jgi:hypothetical protein
MFTYKDWEDFSNYLISINRFVLDDRRKEIVKEIIKLAKQNEDVIKKDEVFWRARINNNELKIVNKELIRVPYTQKEMMNPPSDVVRGGRANPPGITYLYASDEIETAIAEAKPYLNAKIDLLSIKLKKDIKVIDIQKYKRGETLLSLTIKEIDNLWFGIQLSFAVPLPPDDKFGYIPTQYLAELFKNNGYDGIIYGSVQRENFRNLVIFDRTNIEPGRMEERDVRSIEYIDNVGHLKKKKEEDPKRKKLMQQAMGIMIQKKNMGGDK